MLNRLCLKSFFYFQQFHLFFLFSKISFIRLFYFCKTRIFTIFLYSLYFKLSYLFYYFDFFIQKRFLLFSIIYLFLSNRIFDFVKLFYYRTYHQTSFCRIKNSINDFNISNVNKFKRYFFILQSIQNHIDWSFRVVKKSILKSIS